MSVTERTAITTPHGAAMRVDAIGVLARCSIVAAVLLASGIVRGRQEARVLSALELGMASPVTLADLPMNLGAWRGEATELDPAIAIGTGATEVVTRRYVNQETGVRVDVILLFGRAVNMYAHSPEVCYPAAGFGLEATPEEVVIPAGDSEAKFRAMVYSKGSGPRDERQEVVYSWWYNGRWSPEAGKLKHFERISGMYKVHVARLVAPGEGTKPGGERPSESFLKALLPELQRRLSERAALSA